MQTSELIVTRSHTIRDALGVLNATGIGHIMLVDDDDALLRVITDGDLRRALLDGADMDSRLSILPDAKSVTATMETPAHELRELFERHGVALIPRLDSNGIVRLVEHREHSSQILLSTPHLGDQELRFVQEAFDTNWIAPLGPQVEAFERELAEYSGISDVAALSSGTAALHLGLILLGVTDGDRVYCSSFTFAASANPILYQRAEPVFIDSEPDSWNMSPQALERAFARDEAAGRLPRAVIVANLYGQSADMDPIVALCDHYGVPILEDAAESLGATYKGKKSGSFGKIGIFSFNGNKIITTSGGGALCADDPEIVERARFLATQAREPVLHYEHRFLGYNYRLSNVLAGIGRGQLRVIDERVARRRQIFEIYREELAGLNCISWMPEPQGFFSTRWLTTLTISGSRQNGRIEELASRLRTVGIEVRPLWKPMHQQPLYRDYDYYPHRDDCSVSDGLFETGLCLPSGSNLSDDEVRRVAAQLGHMLAA